MTGGGRRSTVAHMSTVHGPTPLSVGAHDAVAHVEGAAVFVDVAQLDDEVGGHAARGREQPRGHRADHLDVVLEDVRRVDEHVAPPEDRRLVERARARSRVASRDRRRASGTGRAGRRRTSRRLRRRAGASRREPAVALAGTSRWARARASGQSSSSRQRLTPCTNSRTRGPSSSRRGRRRAGALNHSTWREPRSTPMSSEPPIARRP